MNRIMVVKSKSYKEKLLRQKELTRLSRLKNDFLKTLKPEDLLEYVRNPDAYDLEIEEEVLE